MAGLVVLKVRLKAIYQAEIATVNSIIQLISFQTYENFVVAANKQKG
jgi:hypothetical protein